MVIIMKILFTETKNNALRYPKRKKDKTSKWSNNVITVMGDYFSSNKIMHT